MFKVSNRSTRKIYLLISKITLKTSKQRHQLFAGGICPEPCFGQFFLEYIPICNQKSAFSSAFRFDGPQILAIPLILFYEKSLPKYVIHENSKCQHFSISEKAIPKTDKIFNFLLYIQKAAISVDILIFCNILHLKMDF